MNIYVSHSTSFDFNKELYETLRNSSLNNDYEFILPHEESSEQFNTLDLFKSGICNLVLAEVSFPSTGQGTELGWANILNIPIIAIYREINKISGAINVLTNKIYSYKTLSELLIELKLD